MKFENKLISGLLVKRYKRFFVDIKIGNKIITAHCPNTGSMYGLLKSGNRVWLTESSNPKRKLKYTLQIIENNKKKIGINTHLTNKIVLGAIKNKLIPEFENITNVKQEVKFGDNTRFDFFLSNNKYKYFLEIKNVTLSRKKSIAEFPDAITSRGAKHISELLKAKKKNYKIYILFVIQREDCTKFKIANDIDQIYSNLLSKGIKKGLKILCYDCKFLSKGIKLNKPLKFIK
jgi:sugar fermentation stimulation protein A